MRALLDDADVAAGNVTRAQLYDTIKQVLTDTGVTAAAMTQQQQRQQETSVAAEPARQLYYYDSTIHTQQRAHTQR